MSFQSDDFYSPIREKIDYARILLKSAQLILLKNELKASDCGSNMKLVIDKMSRLFFYSPGKFYSISFPFLVQFGENNLIKMKTLRGIDVDNRSISECLSILLDKDFSDHHSPVDHCLMSDGKNLLGLNFLEEIFLTEPAYVRYDNDPENQNGRIHPLDHLDINYSSYGTYKIGLTAALPTGDFEDILNIKTECHFLNK